MKRQWYICDDGRCLYEAAKADRAGMVRCVKHGAILNGAWKYEGMTREEIRKRQREEDERAGVLLKR